MERVRTGNETINFANDKGITNCMTRDYTQNGNPSFRGTGIANPPWGYGLSEGRLSSTRTPTPVDPTRDPPRCLKPVMITSVATARLRRLSYKYGFGPRARAVSSGS